MRPCETSAPLIARIGGISADVMERFSTPLCEDAAELDRLEGELATARGALAERLHPLVPAAAPGLRRFLLAVKRDAHNGRPLSRHAASPLWPRLGELSGGEASRALALEEAAAGRAAAFERRFAAARAGERRALAASLDDRAFFRGVALANPEIARVAHRLRDEREGEGHGRKKAEATLLRYLSRAAMKLSPFSTLTPVALAALRDDLEPGPPRLVNGEWRARSLVRIKPYLLDEYGEMLRRHPPLRGTLAVALNSSATEVEPGCFLFLRPSRWDFDEKAGRLAYHEQSLVTVRLHGPLVTRLLERLASAEPPLAELVGELEREFAAHGTARQVAGQVDQLIGLGFLHLLLPWPAGDPHLEKRILHSLRGFPEDSALARFIARLEELVRMEDGYAVHPDPVRARTEMEEEIGELWRAAVPLGGLGPEAGYGRASVHNVYEEVFLHAAGPGPTPAAVHLSRAAAAEALRSVRPLVRLTTLFDHRHEFLHAMAAFAARRWPGSGGVGVMELFREIRPLWSDYQRFRVESRAGNGWRATWNPLELPEVEALARHRAETLDGLAGCLVVEGQDQRVRAADLEALLDRAPARYTSASCGACLFLQPASTDGSLWMLNRIKEGTGRFGSRYTPAMDPAARAEYASRLSARGRLEVDGEEAELLDLWCAQGDNLNVHAPQTPRVLALPGERPGVPPARQLGLRDLRVSFGGPGRAPALRGRDGQRFVAAYLGVAYEDYVPSLVRFLCVFGPSEMGAVFPPPASHADGPVTFTRRTLLGSVVLHRRAWAVPAAVLRQATAGLDEARAFAALNRWRLAHGIPARVFLSERSSHPVQGTRFQPQYVDFTSPAFVALFRAAVEGQDEPVSMVEMLPTPEMFSRDAAGARRAVEILVDSLALRPEGLSVAHVGARAGAASPPAPAGSVFT